MGVVAGSLTDIDRLQGSKRELRVWVSGINDDDILRTWVIACKYGLSRTVEAVEEMVTRRMLSDCTYGYAPKKYTNGLICEACACSVARDSCMRMLFKLGAHRNTG